MAKLFHDSKTFVDKKLRFHPELVSANFTQLMNITGNQPSKNDLVLFINENFESEGSEFAPWDPSDWHENPSFLKKINNPQLRNWGQELHGAWKFLGRKIKGNDNVYFYYCNNFQCYKNNRSCPRPTRVVLHDLRASSFHYPWWKISRILLLGLVLDCSRSASLTNE